MSIIERYYLIDYENVGVSGLEGCSSLKKSEHVIIFFTPNARKIDMSSIANLGGADLEMIEVPAGKQSTDIHIGSYIGFLAGVIDERKRSMQRYPEAQTLEREFSVVIVSKDKDYDNVLKFWKDKTGIKVARTEAIRTSKSEKDVTEPAKPESKKAAAPEPVKKPAQEIEAAGKKAGKQAEKQTAGKQTNKPAKVAKPAGEELVLLNNKIQQTLSKAKIASEVIGYVAPLAVKKHGSEDGKQQVYKTLVAKYGQKQGLNLYNHIKKIL